jgi:putative oxidoreductase
MTSLPGNRTVRVIALILRLALGAVFIYAAWTKLRDPWAVFAVSIDSFQVLPLWGVEWVARTLPWFELAVGVLLISGRWLHVSTAASSLLLLVFFGLLVRAQLKGMQINCGCFGPDEPLSWKTVMRDGALLSSSLLITGLTFRTRLKIPQAR